MSALDQPSRRGSRFLDAADWVDEQFAKEEVQRIVMNNSSKSRFLDAAELVEPWFRQQFPHPYSGETDEDFAVRQARTRPKRRANMVQWSAESPEEHMNRMKRLRKVCSARFE